MTTWDDWLTFAAAGDLSCTRSASRLGEPGTHVERESGQYTVDGKGTVTTRCADEERKATLAIAGAHFHEAIRERVNCEHGQERVWLAGYVDHGSSGRFTRTVSYGESDERVDIRTSLRVSPALSEARPGPCKIQIEVQASRGQRQGSVDLSRACEITEHPDLPALLQLELSDGSWSSAVTLAVHGTPSDGLDSELSQGFGSSVIFDPLEPTLLARSLSDAWCKTRVEPPAAATD